ncbi:MAG: hypothetical protein Q7T55_10895 [Solirubrobacteraceae bacterium]|nr:hypothetical protein [Solirubrobacteraceae bacterium]
MSRVDFFAVPDRAELGQELRQAFRELGLDDVQETEPADGGALLGVVFADGLEAAELEGHAEELRVALASLLTGGPSVTYKLVAG